MTRRTLKTEIIFFTLIASVILELIPAHATSAGVPFISHVVVIDPSSTSVGILGKATLTIGALKQEGNIFFGNYQLKVSPYSSKNENGWLKIVVPEAAVFEVTQGKMLEVTGIATTAGSGKSRMVRATVTPTNHLAGTLRLRFTAEKRKMIFEPAYRFVEQ